jgi:hypothetical protein
MARTKKQSVEAEVNEPVQWHDIENNSTPAKPTGLTKFKVLTPVLGYKAGDTFEATYDSVKRQLKHKSIELA